MRHRTEVSGRFRTGCGHPPAESSPRRRSVLIRLVSATADARTERVDALHGSVSCVCFSLLLAENPVTKMLAPGLGLSVIIDATVIRPALVPATMSLLEAWLLVAPRRLGAVVPQMRRSRPDSTDRCR